jgi:N-acetylmuramoyl-L-alanine amidase
MSGGAPATPIEVLAARARVALNKQQGRTSPRWLRDLADQEVNESYKSARTEPETESEGLLSQVVRLHQAIDADVDPPRTYRLGDRALAKLPGRLMHGNDVRELQIRLAEMGYDEVGPVDGVFGSDTEVAVRRFQNDFGILNDGVCGRVTARVMKFLRDNGVDVASDVTPAQRNLISFIVHAQHSGLILVDLVSRRLSRPEQTTAALEDLLLESLGSRLEDAIERLTGMQTWIVGIADFATDEDNLVSFATNIGSELFVTLSVRNQPDGEPGCVVYYFGDEETGIYSNIGRPLATYVHEELSRTARPPNLDMQAEQSTLFQRVQAPTIRIEFGNLASPRDRDRLLSNNQYLDALAEGAARGIKRLYLLGQQDEDDKVLNLGTFARRSSRPSDG